MTNADEISFEQCASCGNNRRIKIMRAKRCECRRGMYPQYDSHQIRTICWYSPRRSYWMHITWMRPNRYEWFVFCRTGGDGWKIWGVAKTCIGAVEGARSALAEHEAMRQRLRDEQPRRKAERTMRTNV